MLKEHKGKLILSSIIILLPILLGIVLWNHLPEMVVTHWGANGEPNGYSPKAFVVFGLPLILFALHIVSFLSTQFSSKQIAQNKKAVAIMVWIIPALSVFCFGMTYGTALGKEINMGFAAPLATGFLFILIGNYLPKITQNYVLGIKLPWTLQNEENWNKTHRLSGKIWVVCGFIMLLSAFISGQVAFVIMMVLIVVMVGVPTVYSYKLYQKSQKEE